MHHHVIDGVAENRCGLPVFIVFFLQMLLTFGFFCFVNPSQVIA